VSQRLTAAQACVRFLAGQLIAGEGGEEAAPYFAGVWAIFGHGNVGGLGEALGADPQALPVFRAHNEQAMAHAAIAFAKASRRRRAMVVTTSIGPGAVNLATAAAAAHVSRLPVLLLPGDVYASRRPDPVLQQVEDFVDATVSANDALRPLSRTFDRITRPEQLLTALPRAMAQLTDPAACGPATLAFCQDVQSEAFDWPDSFLAPRIWSIRRPRADPAEIGRLADLLRACRAPLLIAGGGVLYSGAEAALAALAEATGTPVAETQGGKGALAFDHPLNLGGIGVNGTSAANAAAAQADLVVGVGTRLTDFTTGSRALFAHPRVRFAQINANAFDAAKHGATAVVGDARAVLEALAAELAPWRAPISWTDRCGPWRTEWDGAWRAATAASDATGPPSDAQVIGAAWRAAPRDAVVVAASGGLPGELNRLWRPREAGDYHVEYGFSCMGYEIAGGLGVKMANPRREVIVLVGDGAYLMLNSEIATSVAMGLNLTIVVLDNRGFACIDRLQRSLGQPASGNMLSDAAPAIDFAAHAASLGAISHSVVDVAELEAALARAFAAGRTSVVVIATDPAAATTAGGAWWDVAASEVSQRESVRAARRAYEAAMLRQRPGG
jgi:3D-(3,5/4)-trihydroxycyclohexane-1,2-dione acylhydrolase (decyclizing)